MTTPLFSPGLFQEADPASDLTEEEKDALFQERGELLVEQGTTLFRKQHQRSDFAHTAFAETQAPPKEGEPITEEPSLVGLERFDDRYGTNVFAQAMTLPGTERKPDPETEQPNRIQDTVNFLFGDDMAILGMKWDQDGFSFAYDTAMEQWSEHPVMSSISALGLAASLVFPVIGGVRKSAKVGLLAQKGLTPTRSLLRTAEEAPFFRRADEVRAMAREVNEIGQPRFFNEKMAQKIATATDEEVERMVSDRAMKRMLLADDHMQRWMELKVANETGQATPFQQMRYQARTMFANDWFKMLNSPTRQYINSMDNFYATSGIGAFLAAAPGPKHGKTIYKYLAGISDQNALKAAGLNDEEVRWAVELGEQMTNHQKKMLDEGFITQEEFDTFKAFGERHLPALHKGTPGALDFSSEETILKAVEEGSGAVRPSKRKAVGKVLTSPTLQQRRKYLTHEDVIQDLDKFITNPKDLTVAGLARDKQLYHGYSFLRDMALQAGGGGPLSPYVKSADDILSMSGVAQRQWVSLDEIPVKGAADRLRRMMEKKLGVPVRGKLPYVHKRVIDEFFGHEGFIGQTVASANALEILTAIHKTARTALNPATHFQNAAGNFFGFLPMAGYNLLNPLRARERLGDGRMLSQVFIKAARQINKDRTVTEVFDYDNLKQLFTDVNGSHVLQTSWGELDMAEMFSNRIMLSTMEESAFESVEGFAHVKKVLDSITKLEERGLLQGRFAAKKIAEIFSKTATGGKREAALHAMSSAYLGEDVVPKMMYALELAKEGMSLDQVVLEVGRRLPQYQSVGSSIGGLRKMWLPWITFPAEATRIMKNNIMDYPIRMMPWLQLPHMIQGFASGVGIAPDLNQIEEIRKGAPQWADRPTSVLLNQRAAAPALGGITGAIMGGLGGMAAAGAPGAVAGATGLGAAGAAVGHMMEERFGPDDHEERVRSWVMDFLPWSATIPASTSEFAEPHDARGILDLSPIEPLAVLMPIINTMQGRGSFGSEIRSTGMVDSMSKAALGLMGFVSPPWMQKYGMKVEGPGGVYVPMADTQEDLGGHHVLPRAVTGAFGAAATGLFMKRAGPAAAIGGAILGGTAGLGMNTRRFMQDIGAMGNPYTQEPGNPVFDVFFNTFAGLPKTWEVSPKQRLVNENFRSRKFTEMRTALTKQLDDAITNDAPEEVNRQLERIYKTFLTETGSPARAQQKFLEWEMRHIKTIGRIPALRGMSEEEILQRMLEASEFAQRHRDTQSKRIVQTLQQELVGRRIGRMGSGSRGGTRRFRY